MEGQHAIERGKKSAGICAGVINVVQLARLHKTTSIKRIQAAVEEFISKVHAHAITDVQSNVSLFPEHGSGSASDRSALNSEAAAQTSAVVIIDYPQLAEVLYLRDVANKRAAVQADLAAHMILELLPGVALVRYSCLKVDGISSPQAVYKRVRADLAICSV